MNWIVFRAAKQFQIRDEDGEMVFAVVPTLRDGETATKKRAQLIAAAPAMLAALEYMMAAHRQPFDHADRRASLEQARGAIAKARGD